MPSNDRKRTMDDAQTVIVAKKWKAVAFGRIGRKFKAYAAVTALSVVVGVAWVAMTKVSYQASATLTAVDHDHGSGASLKSAVSGTLGLAISSLNIAKNFGSFEVLLTSTRVVKLVEHKYHIADMLKIPPSGTANVGLLGHAVDGIKESLGIPVTPVPRFERLLDYVRANMSARPILETESIKVTFQARKPELAKKILTVFINETNAVLKKRAADRADTAIKFLQKEFSMSPPAGVSGALYERFLSDKFTLTMLGANLPYSVQILDPPFASVRPYWPRPVFQIAVIFVVFQVLYFSALGFRYIVPVNEPLGAKENDSESLIRSEQGNEPRSSF